MKEFIFYTKLGHFLFVVVIAGILGGILCSIFHSISFIPLIIGASVVGGVLAAFDHNNKWI